MKTEDDIAQRLNDDTSGKCPKALRNIQQQEYQEVPMNANKSPDNGSSGHTSEIHRSSNGPALHSVASSFNFKLKVSL
eukprot:5544386-Amphidinium_carterae.2